VQGELGGAAFALTLPAALHEHGAADRSAPVSEAPGVRVAS
jgi:hypothetical protein